MDTDILHDHNDRREWNESFYFNFYDIKNDICGFMRMGLKPNKDEKSMFCFLMLPDGSFVGSRSSVPLENEELRVSGLEYRIIERERSWRLSFDGPMKVFGGNGDTLKVNFDLVFSGINKVFNYRECVSGFKEAISQSVASEHLEQFGSITGILKLDGKGMQIDATGERDHSWGERDWNSPKMWIWLTAQFSKDVALNVTKLCVPQGEVDAGFFHIAGVDHPIVCAAIDTRFGKDGAPVSFQMELTDKNGDARTVRAAIIKNVKMPFESDNGLETSIMHETLAEYEFEGRKGYGIAEYLIKKE
ncbi:MAG: hypothetical protein JW825_06680 [Candidatus Methanofastidiosa archaeon]|nr:hypothetical protein [Candidatus Methanofastidiosa archaeon]